jgi:putative glycosyl hydrolase
MPIQTLTTRALAITGVLLGLLAAAPASSARFAVGIGDQHPESFSQPLFQQLGFSYARLIVPWDALRRPDELARVDAWLTAARVSRVRPLVTFNHSRVKPRTLPSPNQFKREFRAFRKRYPFVRDYSPWNEINHQSQPTFRKPRAAARFYNVVRASCRGCTIVAADVLDQAGLEKYLRTFLRFARGTPRLWGLHNYSDTNRFRSRGTKSLLRTVRGSIWLTETGGIVKFADVLPYNEQRAARATKYMFKLARSSRRIRRLYIYSWLGENRGARFDAGLVGPDGSARPAFHVVKKVIDHR